MTDKYNDLRPFTISTGIRFEPYISKKEELKEGDIVTLRNGDRLLYAPKDDTLFPDFEDLGYSNNYLCNLSDLKDDLTYDGDDRDNDIVKVERSVRTEIVFERKDSAREMTIEEISKELGYDVKVVKKK